jgi:hypothetical protein
MIMGGVAGVAIFVTALAAGAETDLDAYTKTSREVIKAYSDSLKAELTGAIKASGPVSAIMLCNHKAPAITRYHAGGATMRRSSCGAASA